MQEIKETKTDTEIIREAQKHMKFLGLLYGASLWLDTKDEKVAKLAEQHLEALEKRSKELAALERDKEIVALGQPPASLLKN